MAAFRTLLAAASVVALIAGCASDSDESVAFDPAGANSCQELADMFVASHQRMLEALGTATDADMSGEIPADVQAASEEVDEWLVGSAGERVTELCDGGIEEFEALACEQVSTLLPQGEAGERHMREAFPPCD